MKFLIVFVALFAIALAAPAPGAEIVESKSDVGPHSWAYKWVTKGASSYGSSSI